MADFSIASLTTAVVGIASTSYFLTQSTAAYTISVTNGTVSLENYDISKSSTVPGFLTGRRLVQGQLYPRGVFNK